MGARLCRALLGDEEHLAQPEMLMDDGTDKFSGVGVGEQPTKQLKFEYTLLEDSQREAVEDAAAAN